MENSNSTIMADIRNKFQLPKTILSCLSKGKKVPQNQVELSFKELSAAENLLNKLDKD